MPVYPGALRFARKNEAALRRTQSPRCQNCQISVLAEYRGKVRFKRKGRPPVTMSKDDIQLLYEYDRWANNRILQAVSALSAEQFTCDLSGSFRSVRDTLVHIIGGEWVWLAYWKEPSHSARIASRASPAVVISTNANPSG